MTQEYDGNLNFPPFKEDSILEVLFLEEDKLFEVVYSSKEGNKITTPQECITSYSNCEKRRIPTINSLKINNQLISSIEISDFCFRSTFEGNRHFTNTEKEKLFPMRQFHTSCHFLIYKRDTLSKFIQDIGRYNDYLHNWDELIWTDKK